VGGAIVWLFLVPLGVPLFFTGLLYYFSVPRIAKLKVNNEWLREAIEHMWRHAVPQPPVNVRTATCDSISDVHLEQLHAYLVRRVTKEEAAKILSGESVPAAEEEAAAAAAAAADPSLGSAQPSMSMLSRVVLCVHSMRVFATSILHPAAAAEHAQVLRTTTRSPSRRALTVRRRR
jgi:hypothetical protein